MQPEEGEKSAGTILCLEEKGFGIMKQSVV